MTAENQNFEMYAGDTKNIVIPVTDSDGNDLDLDGATVEWVLKPNVYTEDTAVTKTTDSGIDIEGSEITIRLEPDDTQNLSGLYYHEAEVTDATGNVSTVTTGNVNIKRSGT